jgi:hypothetical protein
VKAAHKAGADAAGKAEALGDEVIDQLGWAGTPEDDPSARSTATARPASTTSSRASWWSGTTRRRPCTRSSGRSDEPGPDPRPPNGGRRAGRSPAAEQPLGPAGELGGLGDAEGPGGRQVGPADRQHGDDPAEPRPDPERRTSTRASPAPTAPAMAAAAMARAWLPPRRGRPNTMPTRMRSSSSSNQEPTAAPNARPVAPEAEEALRPLAQLLGSDRPRQVADEPDPLPGDPEAVEREHQRDRRPAGRGSPAAPRRWPGCGCRRRRRGRTAAAARRCSRACRASRPRG